MKHKKAIIFDFDGTLFNSQQGIINGVLYALDHFQIAHPNGDVLTSFIGPPLGHSFKSHFHLSDNDVATAIMKLREYYSEKGVFESTPYDGILALLQQLQLKNKLVGVATAKPTKYANQILLNHKWNTFFHSVQGSSMQGELFPKYRTISQVIKDLNLYELDEAVMIGDTIYDIKGAQEVGIDSIAVNYGYGKEHDLKDARPNHLVQTVAELSSLLL